MTNCGADHETVAALLKQELEGLIDLNPDCIIICCNSLHKYYDIIKAELNTNIPVMHAVELVANQLNHINNKTTLLLATKFTMEDGFFAKILNDHNINVIIPDQVERKVMQAIHAELMNNLVAQESKDYFSGLIAKYSDADAIILGCTDIL